MTRSMFYRRMYLITVILICVLLIAAGDKFGRLAQGKIFEFLKDMSTFILILVVPYIASIFSRRLKFIETLYDCWKTIIDSKTAVFKSTIQINDENILSARLLNSTAIEKVRAIYRNYGESNEWNGLYVFEPLHDIRKMLVANHQQIQGSPSQVKFVWNNFDGSFRVLRDVFLHEFDRYDAEYPIIMRFIKTLRKDGISDGDWMLAEKKHRLVASNFGWTNDFSRD
jgi:hypothetical protein